MPAELGCLNVRTSTSQCLIANQLLLCYAASIDNQEGIGEKSRRRSNAANNQIEVIRNAQRQNSAKTIYCEVSDIFSIREQEVETQE
jgi:hypothetical protein